MGARRRRRRCSLPTQKLCGASFPATQLKAGGDRGDPPPTPPPAFLCGSHCGGRRAGASGRRNGNSHAHRRRPSDGPAVAPLPQRPPAPDNPRGRIEAASAAAGAASTRRHTGRVSTVAAVFPRCFPQCGGYRVDRDPLRTGGSGPPPSPLPQSPPPRQAARTATIPFTIVWAETRAVVRPALGPPGVVSGLCLAAAVAAVATAAREGGGGGQGGG